MIRATLGSLRAQVARLFSPERAIGFDEVLVMLESQAKAGATQRLFDDSEPIASSFDMDEFLWDSAYVEPEDINEASRLLQEIFESWWDLPNEVLGRLTVHLSRARRHLLWLRNPHRTTRERHTILSQLIARIRGWRSAFFLYTERHARYRLHGQVPRDATSPSSAQAHFILFARPA